MACRGYHDDTTTSSSTSFSPPPSSLVDMYLGLQRDLQTHVCEEFHSDTPYLYLSKVHQLLTDIGNNITFRWWDYTNAPIDFVDINRLEEIDLGKYDLSANKVTPDDLLHAEEADSTSGGVWYLVVIPLIYYLLVLFVLSVLVTYFWYIDQGAKRWTGRSSMSTMSRSRGTLRDIDSDDGGFGDASTKQTEMSTRQEVRDLRQHGADVTGNWSLRSSLRTSSKNTTDENIRLAMEARMSGRTSLRSVETLTSRGVHTHVETMMSRGVVDALKSRGVVPRRPEATQTFEAPSRDMMELQSRMMRTLQPVSMTSMITGSTESPDEKTAIDLKSSMESQKLLWSPTGELKPDAMYKNSRINVVSQSGSRENTIGSSKSRRKFSFDDEICLPESANRYPPMVTEVTTRRPDTPTLYEQMENVYTSSEIRRHMTRRSSEDGLIIQEQMTHSAELSTNIPRDFDFLDVVNMDTRESNCGSEPRGAGAPLRSRAASAASSDASFYIEPVSHCFENSPSHFQDPDILTPYVTTRATRRPARKHSFETVEEASSDYRQDVQSSMAAGARVDPITGQALSWPSARQLHSGFLYQGEGEDPQPQVSGFFDNDNTLHISTNTTHRESMDSSLLPNTIEFQEKKFKSEIYLDRQCSDAHRAQMFQGVQNMQGQTLQDQDLAFQDRYFENQGYPAQQIAEQKVQSLRDYYENVEKEKHQTGSGFGKPPHHADETSQPRNMTTHLSDEYRLNHQHIYPSPAFIPQDATNYIPQRLNSRLSSAYSTSQLELGVGQGHGSDVARGWAPLLDSTVSSDDSCDEGSLSESLNKFNTGRDTARSKYPYIGTSRTLTASQHGSVTSSATGDALADNMSTRPRLGSVISVFTDSLSGQPDLSTDDVTNAAGGGCMEVSGLSGMENSGFVADPEELLAFDRDFGDDDDFSRRNVRHHQQRDVGVTYVTTDGIPAGAADLDVPDVLKTGKVSTRDRLREYGFIKMVGRKKYVVNPSPGKFFRRKSSSGGGGNNNNGSRKQGQGQGQGRSISKSRMTSVARRLQRSPSPRLMTSRDGGHVMEEERQLLMSDPHHHHQVKGKPPRPGKGSRSRHLSA